MQRPLYYIFIFLIIGTISGYYFTVPVVDYVIFTIIISVIFILFLLFFKKSSTINIFFTMLIIFAIGFVNVQLHQNFSHINNHLINFLETGEKKWEGTIIDNPICLSDKTILIVRLMRVKENGTYHSVIGNTRLMAPANIDFQYGDFIRFSSAMKEIKSFRNPGSFNYKRHLNMKNIHSTAYVFNKTKIISLRKDTASFFRSKLENYRLYLKTLLCKYASSPEKEVIEAMTLGNKRNIPSYVRENFNNTGTAHILAISGFHIGMVFFTGFFLFSFILKRSEYILLKFNVLKIASGCAFIFVLIYAAIAGLGITVTRATLMALIFLIAFLFGQRKDPLNILALIGIIILIFSPQVLFDISFQLSFSAVFAIIYIVPRFNNFSFSLIKLFPNFLKSTVKKIYLLIIICVAASIGTFPLIIFYFNRISAVTVIANLVSVILLGTISLALAMGFVISAPVSKLIAGSFIKLAAFFVQISLWLIEKMASFSWSSFAIVKPTLFEIAIFYLSVFLLMQLIDLRFKNSNDKKNFLQKKPLLLQSFLICCFLFFLFNSVYLYVKEKNSINLRITAIDVGQGSATLVRFPKGKNMLIDGGGFPDSSFDMGKVVIAPFLYSQRIKTIHIIVLTHPHPDHFKGLPFITDKFNVDEIWSTGQRCDDEIFLEWEKTIKKKNIKTRSINAYSEPIKINGVLLNFLWPPNLPKYKANDFNYKKVNDDSLVIKMKYGNVSFLLPADISSTVENILTKTRNDLKSNVLFVPHHGSRHSSSEDFIRKVSCSYSIFSSGKNNLFNHPHKQTLQRYRKVHAKIYRTDESGAITISTNGSKVQIDTYVKDR